MSAVRDFRFNLDSIPDEQRTLRTSHQENQADETAGAEDEEVDEDNTE